MKSTNPLHGIITDDMVRAMRERDEARRQEAVAKLDGQYLLHPHNHVQPKGPRAGGGLPQICLNCFVVHAHNPIDPL